MADLIEPPFVLLLIIAAYAATAAAAFALLRALEWALENTWARLEHAWAWLRGRR